MHPVLTRDAQRCHVKKESITDMEVRLARMAEQVRKLMAELDKMRLDNYRMSEWSKEHAVDSPPHIE